MRKFYGWSVVVTGLICVWPTSPVHAIPITPDTFEDGTTMGWHVPGPSPVPPVNVLTGGPDGLDDNYLQLTALGMPAPGGRLAVLNELQWSGDYLAAGITSIAMDVNNFGPDELVLRLLFENFGPVPGPPTDLVLTLASVFVPANSGWMSVTFDLSPANLSALFGTVSGALGDVDTLRIFHNPDPTFPGPNAGIPPVAVTLGVDNINAVTAIPEPGTIILMSTGVAALLSRRRRTKFR